jgi:hypothetical protein
MGFHSQQATLIIGKQQSLLSQLLQQGVDMGVLKLDNLMLPFVGPATDSGEQNVPRLEE